MEGLEWKSWSELRGRSIKLIGADGVMGVVPVPDDLFLCDFCNERILEDPIPVFEGHALCRKCMKRIEANSR